MARARVALIGAAMSGVAIAGAVSSSACDFSDGPLNPAPRASGSGGHGGVSGSGGMGGEGGGAGGSLPTKRTVEIRNPWGGPADNLLVDGDFEMAILLEGHDQQSGWLAFKAKDPVYLRGETGGLCKTGLRCGVLEPGVTWLGRGTSALSGGMMATIASKPPVGLACAVVKPTVIRCDFNGKSADLSPELELPDKDGWCRYLGEIPATNDATCFIVESELPVGTTALIDSATLLAVMVSSSVELAVTPPEREERYRWIARSVRKRLPFGRASQAPFLYGR